ncbi:MAG: hypothetical protein K8S99_04480 [Planctomycetes bacterium]|nr:hypothetical protein [Planctomycetota bacterium]
MDIVTGSLKHERSWTFWPAPAPTFTPSPLEIRLRKIGVPWTPRWKSVSSGYFNFFGGMLGRGCGSAPPISDLLRDEVTFAADATDDEVRAFVHVMEFGTEAQQKDAVNEAWEKYSR